MPRKIKRWKQFLNENCGKNCGQEESYDIVQDEYIEDYDVQGEAIDDYEEPVNYRGYDEYGPEEVEYEVESEYGPIGYPEDYYDDYEETETEIVDEYKPRDEKGRFVSTTSPYIEEYEEEEEEID